MARRILSIAIALAGAVLIFFVWIAGGFEQFQPPIEIVLPRDFSGVICATSMPNSSERRTDAVRYEVSSAGLLLVDGDILQSHRKRKFFAKTAMGSPEMELSGDTMLPINTENDVASGASYSVYWVGGISGWDKFKDAQQGRAACLGRF
jgi:hypothetical protein